MQYLIETAGAIQILLWVCCVLNFMVSVSMYPENKDDSRACFKCGTILLIILIFYPSAEVLTTLLGE